LHFFIFQIYFYTSHLKLLIVKNKVFFFLFLFFLFFFFTFLPLPH